MASAPALALCTLLLVICRSVQLPQYFAGKQLQALRCLAACLLACPPTCLPSCLHACLLTFPSLPSFPATCRSGASLSSSSQVQLRPVTCLRKPGSLTSHCHPWSIRQQCPGRPGRQQQPCKHPCICTMLSLLFSQSRMRQGFLLRGKGVASV